MKTVDAALVVTLIEDEDDHTRDHPYCGDVSCWCHSDSDYHTIVTQTLATEEEIAEVYAYLGLEVSLCSQ